MVAEAAVAQCQLMVAEASVEAARRPTVEAVVADTLLAVALVEAEADTSRVEVEVTPQPRAVAATITVAAITVTKT